MAQSCYGARCDRACPLLGRGLGRKWQGSGLGRRVARSCLWARSGRANLLVGHAWEFEGVVFGLILWC